MFGIGLHIAFGASPCGIGIAVFDRLQDAVVGQRHQGAHVFRGKVFNA